MFVPLINEWYEWNGGDCPAAPGATVEIVLRNGEKHTKQPAGSCDWTHGRPADLDIVRYRVISADAAPPAAIPTLTGGKLSGGHYYRVEVPAPISPEVTPYVAECADIIEALGMTFNEGEAFKALWRLAAARQGRGKPGNQPQYDADKVAHYGERVKVQTERGQR